MFKPPNPFSASSPRNSTSIRKPVSLQLYPRPEFSPIESLVISCRNVLCSKIRPVLHTINATSIYLNAVAFYPEHISRYVKSNCNPYESYEDSLYIKNIHYASVSVTSEWHFLVGTVTGRKSYQDFTLYARVRTMLSGTWVVATCQTEILRTHEYILYLKKRV